MKYTLFFSNEDLLSEEKNENKVFKDQEKNFIPENDKKNVEKYFPVSEEAMPLKDKDLWNIMYKISTFKENFSDDQFNNMVDVGNTIIRIDLRFSALVEIGNYSSGFEDNKPFEKARCYLNEILKDKDPNFALRGLINYIKRYCSFEDGKYIPDYSKCYENFPAINLLSRVIVNIKGGDRSIRKEAYGLCRMLLEFAEKHKDDDYSEYEKHGVYYD